MMSKMRRLGIFAVLLALSAIPVRAEESAAMVPSTSGFVDANDRMHAGMDIDYTGDADVDFVRGMIPHHLGAVDMAKVLLQYGKDPEIRQLANDIIAMQTAEIKQMQTWLDAHAPKPVADKAQ